MKIVWNNNDRAAMGQWLQSDLGRKFSQYISQDRPAIEPSSDANALIFAGGTIKGYSILLEKIDWMGTIPVGPTQPTKLVDISDDPKDDSSD